MRGGVTRQTRIYMQIRFISFMADFMYSNTLLSWTDWKWNLYFEKDIHILLTAHNVFGVKIKTTRIIVIKIKWMSANISLNSSVWRSLLQLKYKLNSIYISRLNRESAGFHLLSFYKNKTKLVRAKRIRSRCVGNTSSPVTFHPTTTVIG